MANVFNPVGGQAYSLGSSISSTDTTILLASFLEPVTGTPLTMANMNTSICYATVSPKTSNSEFISFSGVTQNADGSATLTGVIRGLAKKYPFTSDVAYKRPHSGTSVLILSDVPQLYNNYPFKSYDETITGQWTFTNTPIVPGAVSDASTTVKGVSKLSVDPVVSNNPIAVGDNDSRVPTELIAISSGASDAGKVPKLNSNGKLDSSFLSDGSPIVNVFTSSGTWTKPSGLKYAVVELVGGSNGVQVPTNGVCYGSASGSYVKKTYAASALNATEAYIVGVAGGLTGATASTFKLMSGGAAAGAATGGDLNIVGQGGQFSGFASGSATAVGNGGSNPLGMGGVWINISGFAYHGTGYGSGTSGGVGNGVSSVNISGNGGVVIITEYY